MTKITNKQFTFAAIRIELAKLNRKIDEIRFGYLGITAFLVLINIILLLILIFK